MKIENTITSSAAPKTGWIIIWSSAKTGKTDFLNEVRGDSLMLAMVMLTFYLQGLCYIKKEVMYRKLGDVMRQMVNETIQDTKYLRIQTSLN